MKALEKLSDRRVILNKEIEAVSRCFGLPKREIRERALLYFLDAVRGEVALQDELAFWQRMGGELWHNELSKNADR